MRKASSVGVFASNCQMSGHSLRANGPRKGKGVSREGTPAQVCKKERDQWAGRVVANWELGGGAPNKPQRPVLRGGPGI